ncbi:hypothetical protein K8352_09600 [Flavobacteriaceae bacterium F89]|uniref:Uncharacterized protein n=1 Tax=Cerina litoralis TaxID=2874477 RepID=A0AAE3EWL4_9FLAO|nr:hypothetical protein [Cerina litoralis]MCG2461001.1 hypothetical protein [Cerina litoralis]
MKKTNKNSGFKVPEHYFEGVTHKILERIPPTSGSSNAKAFPKDEGFKVPEGYFENLNKKILERSDKREIKVVQLHPYRKIYYTATAVAAGLLLFFGLRLSLEKPPTFSDLASQDIENYFQINELDMSSYEIAEMFPIDQLEINDVLNDQIQDAAILDYLDNNTDDLEELNLNYNE